MKVRNIAGTSDNTCKCASWLDHWVKFGGGSTPNYCSEKTCLTKKNLVGAHVQKESTADNNWYIIPLCDAHNKKAATLEVGDSTKLAPANVSATCGKK